MAISPPGDIILEVARAADSEKVKAARERLQAFAAARGTTFELSAGSSVARAPDFPQGGRSEHFVKFEAMVLNSFLQTMLPSEGDAFYGEGLSGEMWRSLLAQHLGEVMAGRGGMGIAERVLSDHYLADGKKVPVAGVSTGREADEAGMQAALSSALVQEIERVTAKRIGDQADRLSEE